MPKCTDASYGDAIISCINFATRHPFRFVLVTTGPVALGLVLLFLAIKLGLVGAVANQQATYDDKRADERRKAQGGLNV
jgi:hypothetical protein